jgi:hypothetical protein
MALSSNFAPSSQRYQTQDLQINNSNISSDALVNILACFPKLKKFYYCNGGSTVGYEDFLPQHLGRAIQHLKGSLEELTVVDMEGCGGANGDEEQGSIGSLAGFEKLRHLATYQDFLLKADLEEEAKPRLVDILPASLELLVLGQCAGDVLNEVRELLEQRRQSEEPRFLALKKIIIGLAYKSRLNDAREHAKGIIITDGKAMGIVVVITEPMRGINFDFEAAFHFDGVTSP